MLKKKSKNKKLLIIFLLLILILVILYFFTYFFAKDHKKVIYEKNGRRIYLLERKVYGTKNREMWRMVWEDQKTGKRFFILGNSPKGLNEKKMVSIIVNTVDQGKIKSFDQVERTGITMREAKTDIHSNMIDKKQFPEMLDGFKDLDFELATEI